MSALSSSHRIALLPVEELERRQRRERSPCPQLWELLDTVADPEIPVISLWELGVLQDLERDGDTVVVTITPTYSGCPAMDVIREDIARVLDTAGYCQHRIHTRLAPAWSSQWLDQGARDKLRAFGIAPPGTAASAPATGCPHCGSARVQMISDFGSTACKALYRCLDCREPFDYFKPF